MTEKRGAWYLLTGVILGLVIGLILSAWVIPVQYVNADPSTLRKPDREAYRILVAQAYLVEGDVYRAIARVKLLADNNPSEAIIAQAQNMLANGGSEAQARALALLAAAVNEPSLSVTPLSPQAPVAVQVTEPVVTVDPMITGTVAANLPSRTPGPTSTPRPTQTPAATAGPPFVLDGEPLTKCDQLTEKPLLQITVLNANSDPVAGVKIEISQSNGGTETFYTGLFPEVNRGYADYEMLPGVTYTIRVGESGQPVANLSAPACTDNSGVTSYGNLWLVFQQP